MDKDRYELKGKSFIDKKTNQCLNFGLKDLARVTVTLNSMDRWLEQDKETIADLEAKLAKNKKWLASNDGFLENKKLKHQLAESEKKLNQYPYKNDVIEKQYEELKNGIKFRIENNINDDWEQHYHCIDVLCEKHKARIRDIEYSIGKIQQLEQQLAESQNTACKHIAKLTKIATEKDKQIEQLKKFDNLNKTFFDLFRAAFKEQNKVDDLFNALKTMQEKQHQDKISFAVDILEEIAGCSNYINTKPDSLCGFYVLEKVIKDKIKWLKGTKDE